MFSLTRTRGLPAILLLLSGCGDIDLGEIPFFCNNGDPLCPEGYVCVGNAPGRCVRENMVSRDSKATVPDAGLDSGPDLLMPFPDARRADQRFVPDLPVYKWDTGANDMPKDSASPKNDGWPPHIGCQSHAECTDPSMPCCCPMPLLPQIWDCFVFCFAPLCL